MSVSNRTLHMLSEYVAAAGHGLSCEPINLSSLLLKHVNIIMIDSTVSSSSSSSSNSASNEFTSFSLRSAAVLTSAGNSAHLNATTAARTTEAASSADEYDYDGALAYILFTLFWYSIFIVALLVVQTKKSDLDYFEDGDDPQEVTARNLLKRIRSEDIKKEALEQLRDPVFRKRMWDIYLANPNTYKIKRFESKRIKQIESRIKQYYTVNGSEKTGGASSSGDYYRTVDFSRAAPPPRLDNSLLLRDSARFEPTYNAQNSQYSIQSYDQTALFSGGVSSQSGQQAAPFRFRIEKINENYP